MSTVMQRAFNLRCDFGSCNRLFVLAGTSLFWTTKHARDAARIRGWTVNVEGEDFCERHGGKVPEE